MPSSVPTPMPRQCLSVPRSKPRNTQMSYYRLRAPATECNASHLRSKPRPGALIFASSYSWPCREAARSLPNSFPEGAEGPPSWLPLSIETKRTSSAAKAATTFLTAAPQPSASVTHECQISCRPHPDRLPKLTQDGSPYGRSNTALRLRLVAVFCKVKSHDC